VFVDHDAGKCIHIEVEVCHVKHGQHMDLPHPDDLNAEIALCQKVKTMKHKLKQHVKAIINDKHPGLFDAFQFMKADETKHSEKVNLNHSLAGADIKLRKVFCVTKCIAKFTKGSPKGVWTEMYNYPKTFHKYIFSKDDAGELTELCEIGGPSFISQAEQHVRNFGQNVQNEFSDYFKTERPQPSVASQASAASASRRASQASQASQAAQTGGHGWDGKHKTYRFNLI